MSDEDERLEVDQSHEFDINVAWDVESNSSHNFIQFGSENNSTLSGTPSEQKNNIKEVSNGGFTLYIQMEYCEKMSVKDAIINGLNERDAWKLFRQIVENYILIIM